MPDTLPIDLGRYSVFTPPDPFEDPDAAHRPIAGVGGAP